MAKQLKRFTDEQIDRANRVDILDYARSQGLEMKRAGNSYKVLNYSGGFYITPSKNSWNWFNEDRGGGVVQLCMELENKTWAEAVRTLLNEDMEPIRHVKEWKPVQPEPTEFILPDANNTYKHMTAYLTKTRGIEPSVLKAMIDRKYVYENTYRSCVFVGRDKEGNAHHASIRSTNTDGKAFKQEVPGSQKEYSFNVPGNSGTLNVFEAPIDLLSYVSLQKMLGKQTKDSYLSLGGTSDRALERFLRDYPDIEKIRVCTDNDSPLNATEWDITQTVNRVMYIENRNLVKGQDKGQQMLFKTSTDYARYMQRNLDADNYFISISKDKLHITDGGKLYATEIEANGQYTLYKSIGDFEKGIGFQVSGEELYLRHFFYMPAGEKAAVKIHEKYGKDYHVTRHRPTSKDFNEDLIIYRKQMENVREAESEDIQSQPSNTDTRDRTKDKGVSQNLSVNEELLKQCGMGNELFQWYHDSQDKFLINKGTMAYEGTTSMLIVCEDPNEMMAFMEIDRLNHFNKGYKEPYIPNDHFVIYSNVDVIKEYLQSHPGICVIGVASGRTEQGDAIFKEVQSLNTHNMAVGRMEPKLTSFVQELHQMKKIEKAIEDTPIEALQPCMDVGLEA